MFCDGNMSVKPKGKIQHSGKASMCAWCTDTDNNETLRKETGGERDEDAAMDVWSHEER